MIGVLALQGAFARHLEALASCGQSAREVRTEEQLSDVDALIIPGGESTTMSKLIDSNGLRPALTGRLASGMPVFGTCAGMILLATDVLDGRADQVSFGTIDLAVRRNGYGRQINSFEADLEVADLEGGPLRAIFIRAPKVESIGADVEVMAEVDGVPVLCRQGTTMVASFHPELSDDRRLHQMFVAACEGSLL